MTLRYVITAAIFSALPAFVIGAIVGSMVGRPPVLAGGPGGISEGWSLALFRWSPATGGSPRFWSGFTIAFIIVELAGTILLARMWAHSSRSHR